MKLLATTDDWTLTLLRLAAGVVFFAHGAQKLPGWFGGAGYSSWMGIFTHGMHIPAAFAFLAVCAEFFGGLGLILGFLTRIAAFGIAVEMVVAVVLVHRHFGFFMNWFGTQKGEGYEFHILAVALLIAVLVRGAGWFSLDRLLTRGRETARAAA